MRKEFRDDMRLLTPPVCAVVVAPLPLAAIVWILSGPADARGTLGVGWSMALSAVILWLLLVVPVVRRFGKGHNGHWAWPRVLLSSTMGGFCAGALFGKSFAYFSLGMFDLLFEPSRLFCALLHAYVALIAAAFLMRDPLFRSSG